MANNKEEIALIKRLSGGSVRQAGRDECNCALVGKRRRGKSTLAMRLMQGLEKEFAAQGVKRKILIIDQASAAAFSAVPAFSSIEDLERNLDLNVKHPKKWLSGIRKLNKMPVSDFQILMPMLTEKLRNAVIVWDEANQYLKTSGPLPDWQLPIFSTNGNLAIDNYILLHRLMDIPKQLRGHFDNYFYFATDDSISSVNDLINGGFPGPHQEFFDMMKRVCRKKKIETWYVQYFECFQSN